MMILWWFYNDLFLMICWIFFHDFGIILASLGHHLGIIGRVPMLLLPMTPSKRGSPLREVRVSMPLSRRWGSPCSPYSKDSNFTKVLWWFYNGCMMITWWLYDNVLMILCWFDDDFTIVLIWFYDEFMMIVWWLYDGFMTHFLHHLGIILTSFLHHLGITWVS